MEYVLDGTLRPARSSRRVTRWMSAAVSVSGSWSSVDPWPELDVGQPTAFHLGADLVLPGAAADEAEQVPVVAFELGGGVDDGVELVDEAHVARVGDHELPVPAPLGAQRVVLDGLVA
jgi:hypothetical protein